MEENEKIGQNQESTPNFKIYTYEQIQEHKELFEEVFQYIKMYGYHTMAYSILQPKMNYFIIDGIGIVAYSKLGKHGKTRYVLGDPLVSTQYQEYLIDEFLKVFPKSCFLQISQSTAKILHFKHNFFANILGTETLIKLESIKLKKSVPVEETVKYISISEELSILEKNKDILYQNIDDESQRKDFWQVKKKVHKLRGDLADYVASYKAKHEKSFLDIFIEGENRKGLRRELANAKKEGISIREVFEGEVYDKTLDKISKEWIKNNTVAKKEMSFLTMPFLRLEIFKHNKRIFVAEDESGIVGFLELMPLYQNDSLVGYYADIIRTYQDIPSSTVNFLILTAMNKVFSEGLSLFSLGLSPFHKVEPVIREDLGLRADNPLATLSFKTAYNYGDFLYNAKGQAFHKEKYKVDMEQVYYCTTSLIPLKEIIDGFKLCGIRLT
jgi:lysylphosphatidylglycerol synthetase-like protein (DUF2156 family)